MMPQQTPTESKGLFDSLKGLAASLVAIAHTRLDLLSTEMEEEREHLTLLLIAMLIGLFCLGVGVILMTILVVVAFWDNHRILVLSGFSGIFLAAGIAAWWFALHKIHTKPRLFASSLHELAKDRQHLRL